MKTKTRHFSKFFLLLLAMLLVVGMLPTTALAAGAQEISGLESTVGAGTESDPIKVDTFSELKVALENSTIKIPAKGDL